VLAGFYRRRNAEGDEDLARVELERALDLFEGVHAVGDVARVRGALARGEARLA